MVHRRDVASVRSLLRTAGSPGNLSLSFPALAWPACTCDMKHDIPHATARYSTIQHSTYSHKFSQSWFCVPHCDGVALHDSQTSVGGEPQTLHHISYETFITCSLLAGSLGFSPKLPAAGAHCKVVAFHPLDLLRVCSSWHPSCHPSWHPSCHPSWHPSCHPSCCIPLAPPLYSNPVINPVIPCGAQRKDKRASMPPLMLLWCAA